MKFRTASIVPVIFVLLLAGCGSESGSGRSAVSATSSAGTTIGKKEARSCPPAEVNAAPPVSASQEIYEGIDSLTDNNGPGVTRGVWHVKVVGDTSMNDVLKLSASGFPSNGFFSSKVMKPRGAGEYTDICHVGRFDKNGGMPWWQWDFHDYSNGTWDPPGTYILTITDTTQGSPTRGQSIGVPFVIKVPPPPPP
jgi:hypothetical protein